MLRMALCAQQKMILSTPPDFDKTFLGKFFTSFNRKPFIPHGTTLNFQLSSLPDAAVTYHRKIKCLINIKMKSNELTIKTPISKFPDNQIKESMEECFKIDSPLDLMIGIVEIMSDYIINNDLIDERIKNNFSILDSVYRFNLNLFKKGIGE